MGGLIFLAIWLGSAIACAIIAENKGRSTVGWFFLGFFFGVIALIVIATAPNSKLLDATQATSASTAKIAANMTEADDSYPCPICAETIKKAAIKCRFCGEELPIPPST